MKKASSKQKQVWAVWQHKKTKKKFRVTPWWECPDPIVSDQDIGIPGTDGRKYKVGTLIQIGWLLENEHGVWFGIYLKAKKHFKMVKNASS